VVPSGDLVAALKALCAVTFAWHAAAVLLLWRG